MKALVCKGVKEDLSYEDVELPAAGADEVVVDLRAAALNRRDYWITQGLYPGLQFPTVLGSDGCGVFEGREVIINPNIDWGPDPKLPGKSYHILGLKRFGTFAEQVVVGRDRLHPKPAHLTVAQAAALPLAGLTAYRSLVTRCQTGPEDRVLISGIGGGVATMAFQFALALGADVYVTSSAKEKIAAAERMGASGGVDYRDPEAMYALGKKVGGFDVVIDSAGGEGFNNLLRMCRKGARIGVYGATRGPWQKVVVPTVFFKQISILGSTMGSDEEFGQMLELVNRHRIVPIVDQVFALADGNEAMAHMQDYGHFGKIVLGIS